MIASADPASLHRLQHNDTLFGVNHAVERAGHAAGEGSSGTSARAPAESKITDTGRIFFARGIPQAVYAYAIILDRASKQVQRLVSTTAKAPGRGTTASANAAREHGQTK